MENQEKTTFSLEDNDEVVEEEVIDRDEEYDDEDDGEEDYDDEDYGDEEDYDDEEYADDDGYNDDYYDDRLNKVLDEIADLKRGMQAPSTVVQSQQPPMPPIPQYIYQPQPAVPSAGSEVVMYNEISRLRDELAKNQSSLEMQKEISRIKEDMSRDQKFAEAQYNAEIKRLQDRIDDLLKNASGPQSEQQSANDVASNEGAKLDIDKLLSLNESMMHVVHDGDVRMQNEIAMLRKQIEERPSMDDINRALASVKKAVQNVDVSGLNNDAISKLSADIASLKDALGSGASIPVPAAAAVATTTTGGESDVAASELLRQLYEIKNILGSASASAVKRTQTLCELVNDFKKVNYDVHSQSVPFKDKLNSVCEYVDKLSKCNEPDAVDLIQAVNALIGELSSTAVTRESFADVVAYCQDNGDGSVNAAMREAAEKFFNITDKLGDLELDGIADYITDLVVEKNIVQQNKSEKQNNEALMRITGELLAEERDDEAIKDEIAELAELKLGDVISLSLVRLPKSYKSVRAVDDENVFTKLAELKAAVLDRKNAQASEESANEKSATPSDGSLSEVLDAIDDLRSSLTAATGVEGLNESIDELRNNYLDIAERLVEISEKISVAPAKSEPEEAPASGLTDEEIAKTLDDLDYIRGKLDEHETFITQIADMRADILGMAGTVDNTEQSVFLGERFETLTNELTTQCDKLYEDLSNAILDSESNLATRVTEQGTAVTDAVAEAKSGILDAVAQISDAIGASALGEAMEQLRTDVLNLSDRQNVDADAALVDRQKLLDDVAFLREQAEAAIAEKEQAASEEGDKEDDEVNKLYQYLDDISAHIELLSTLPEDVATARDSVATVIDTLVPMADRLNEIIERMDAAAQAEAEAAEQPAEEIVDPVAEDLALIKEDVAQVRENSVSAVDALSTLAETQDEVKYIKQKLDENSENTVVSDSLANIMNDVGLVLDKLEAFEQQAVNNKQEIVDTVGGIREEIHINELNENMTASGMDEETRDLLVNEIAEIRERLNDIEQTTQSINDVNSTALDSISARLEDLQTAVAQPVVADSEAVTQTLEILSSDIADIKARLDGDDNDGVANESVSSDNLQAIIDELSEIKEKLYADPDYDTVEEILSLREDVKAARIVDQDEISGELEAIKNELAALASGSILDEIRALRDDIASVGVQNGDDAASAPTDDELNLVLNEIVSLRDEVFAFKDEVLNATASAQTDEVEQTEVVESGEDPVTNILDELGDLRNAQSALTDTIEELKDVISRRTTLATESVEGEETVAAPSNELNVVLDEIINLKGDIDEIGERIPDGGMDIIAKQVQELRDRIDALVAPAESVPAENIELDDIRERLDNIALTASTVDFVSLADKIDEIGNAVVDLKHEKENAEINAAVESGEVSGSLAQNLEDIRADIDDVKAAIAGMAAPAVGDEIAELRAEIESLRAENEELRKAQNDAVASELAELKAAVHDLVLSTPAVSETGDASYAALIDEFKSFKDQLLAAQSQLMPTATLDESTLAEIKDALAAQSQPLPIADELADIRDEIAQLRSLTTVSADRNTEIAALHAELAELRNAISASPDSMLGLAEDVTSIKADVQTLKEEPDLGVMNEILALRDEFQALREEIEDVKRIASETDKQSDDNILGEVRSLRDQLFAISMANVNDAASGESNYESYNNIILDEIAAISDRIDAASGESEEIKAISDEISQLKSTIAEREDAYSDIARKIAKLDSDATNNKILEELASLRTELANQRDADLTTLNFMSEMAHLLERQNSYIAQNTGTKISSEIESLKAEIASSDAVAEEVAKLREIMTQSGNASDNETILGELADLREELSSEKPSRENELILQEISRLRDEITALGEREKSDKPRMSDTPSTDELADSLSDLKDQLSEIAGIVDPEQKPKTPRKKPATGAKRGRKPGSKNSTTKSGAKKPSTGAKRGRKPSAQKRTDEETAANYQQATAPTEPEFSEADFAAKVDNEVAGLGGGDAMSLNPNAPSTNDTMDVADKLAQQVANKLVIEQLVEQLGDEGMSDEQVDEILKELPIELNTQALDDQSDKVRKLANQLVLNKLRNRLGGRTPSGDDNNADGE